MTIKIADERENDQSEIIDTNNNGTIALETVAEQWRETPEQLQLQQSPGILILVPDF